MPDLNEFISTEDTAEEFKYHVGHVRRMMREGSIEGVKIGRTWLVRLMNMNARSTTQRYPYTLNPASFIG
jgi:excisionase family DNA binding protein